jgi:tetratricopeptide (TPR) repeat protein
MPDPCRRYNTALRKLMAEYGLTREGLAEAINTAMEEATGIPGTSTARHVGRWLSGDVTWPRDRSRLGLETVFGRSAIDLGFRPPVSGPAGVTVRPPVPSRRQEPPVYRRRFILGLGSLSALPVLPESGRLGMSDISRIRRAEAQLVALDDRYGSARLAQVAARYIEHVEHSMRRCTYGGRVQTSLHQTLGEMCAQTGWLSYDSGQHEQARHWWDTGLRYALLARDSMLQARIWSNMSRQAVDLGYGAEAVAIARAALDATRNRRHPRLSVLLHTRVALGHSMSREKGRCGQSLHRAEQEIDREHDETPPWLAFCGPDELAGQAALCFYNLGDYAKAAQADRDSLASLPPAFRRNQFATHVSLARSLLAGGELDDALGCGHRALDLLPEVRSPRWTAHLAQVRRDVEIRFPAVASEFVDRHQEMTA